MRLTLATKMFRLTFDLGKSMNNNKIYIYGLICPEKQCVRYVGKSINPSARLKVHTSRAEYDNKRKLHRRNWIKSLALKGLIPTLTILEITDSNSWEVREIYWISKLRKDGHALTNMAKGGAGGSGHLGHKHSPETKRKMSLAKQGYIPWMKGKHHSEKSLIQMSNSLKGKPGPNKGKAMSQEQRKKLSIANKGKNKGVIFSDEHKRKISEACKARFVKKRLEMAQNKLGVNDV